MDLGAPTESSTGGGSGDDRMEHFSVGKGERAHDAPFYGYIILILLLTQSYYY